VVVARQVASKLHLILQVIAVKKIGAPHNSELAIGAVCEDGTRVIDFAAVKLQGVTADYLDRQTKLKKEEIRQLILRLGGISQLQVKKRDVIVVDDGIATGTSMQVIIRYLRKNRQAK